MEEHDRETQEKQATSPSPSQSPQPPELSPLRGHDGNDDDMLPPIETPEKSAENGVHPVPRTTVTHTKRGSKMDVDGGVHIEQAQLPPLLPPPPDLSPISEHSDDDDDDDRLPSIEISEISTANAFKSSSNIFTRGAGNEMEEYDRETQENQAISPSPSPQLPELSPIREYSDDDDDDYISHQIGIPREPSGSENSFVPHVVITRAEEGKKKDDRVEYRVQIQLPPLLPPPPDLSPISEHSDDDNDDDRLPPIETPQISAGNAFKSSPNILTHATRSRMEKHNRETQKKQQQPLQPPELSPIREYSDDDDDGDYISHQIGISREPSGSKIIFTYTERGRKEKAKREAQKKQATLPLPLQPPELSPIREHSDDDDGGDMLSSVFIHASTPRRNARTKPLSPILSPLTSDSPSRSPSPQPIPAPLNETQAQLPLSPLSPDISPIRDDYSSSSSSPLFSPFLTESHRDREPDIELLITRPALEELSSDEELATTHKSRKRKRWTLRNRPSERKHGMAQRDPVSQPKQKRIKLSQLEQPTTGAENRQSVAKDRITPSPNPSPPSPPIWDEQHRDKNSAANAHEKQQVSEFKLDKSTKNDSSRQPEIELLDEWSD